MPDPILITGCSTGIGRATAARLAKAGHTVYATARKVEALAGLDGCRTLALDVTSEASMQAAVDAIVAEHGAVGALVNNAGYSQSGAIETVELDAVRRQFETNVFGLMRMSQLVLPSMRERGAGRIVNISSMGANFVFPGGGVYHATKYAVNAISDAMRFEVKGFGVDVVIVEPGLIKTEFADAATASLTAHSEDGPYDHFNGYVGRMTAGAYDSAMIKVVGGGPDRVAKAIEKAITARNPRLRYRVTPSASLGVPFQSLVPDRVWDAMLARSYPRPR